MNILTLLILFLSALVGGAGVFFVNQNPRNLKLILSFSGAFLFAITVLHLIPEVYSGGSQGIGLYVLLGFAFQVVLEQFSKGIEHGHMHLHNKVSGYFPWGIMISLSIHAFIEGIPLSASGIQEGTFNQSLLGGIALHHIPAAFALGSILLGQNISRGKVMMLLLLFALMSPLGAFFGGFLSHGFLGENVILAIVAGIFLHLSTTILFESSVDHKFNRIKTIAILLGGGLAILGFLFA
jgi:zinc and cadmium transporter